DLGSACNKDDECLSSGAKCTGGVCLCTKLYDSAIDRCDTMYMSKFGEIEGDTKLENRDDVCSNAVDFPLGIPIFGDIYKEEASFQLVLVSSGTETYALNIYGHSLMQWSANVNPDIFIGYSFGNRLQTNILSFTRLALRIDEYASTNGISGLVLQKLFDDEKPVENRAVECIRWYQKHVHHKDRFYDSFSSMPLCPCDLASLKNDPFLSPSETKQNGTVCYDMWHREAQGTYGKSCCYNEETTLFNEDMPTAGGFMISHPQVSVRDNTKNDIKPKEWCCSKSDFCDKYYELHPTGKCKLLPVFDLGICWGDPHIRTLDNFNFTFNGLGEFTLFRLRTENITFDMQGRTARPVKADGKLSSATVFTAFAAFEKETNASVHVELNDERDDISIYGNKEDLSKKFKLQPSNFTYKDGNIIIQKANTSVTVLFSRIGIFMNITVAAKLLSINVMVPKVLKGKPLGLLGNYDEDPYNDFVYPNGTGFPFNAKKVTPELNGCSGLIFVSLGTPATCTVEVSEDPSVSVQFKDIADSVYASLPTTGRIRDVVLTIDAPDPFNLRITATNVETNKTKGLTVTILLCTKCHGHGECIEETRVDERATSTFKYAQCICDDQHEDIDECSEGSPCEDLCNNVEGSFVCSCNIGYRIDVSNLTACTDINECDEGLDNCPQQCINTDGGYNCSCFQGFTYNDTTDRCIADIDECKQGICTQICRNYNGGYNCSCHPGYSLLADRTCQECAYGTWGNNCSEMCRCSGEGTSECDRVKGCICNEGYQGDACSEDIDECILNPTICNDARKICFNTIGSYRCECPVGLRLTNGICVDIDECTNVQGDCAHICANTNGFYQCFCNFGYKLLDDRTNCAEIENPCRQISHLKCQHFCVIDRSTEEAKCQCRAGYVLANDGESCDDIDECSDPTANDCSKSSVCYNTKGSYQCKCPEGMKLENDLRTCSGCICENGWFGDDCDLDLNECERSLPVCPDGNITCVNTPGSFECRCSPGYSNTSGVCLDIDECADSGKPACEQTCRNTPGSYICECSEGFKPDNSACVDVDECAAVSQCDHNCINTIGSYRCTCKFGFKLDLSDRRKCLPSPECHEFNITECENYNATCMMFEGVAKCLCRKGFEEDRNNICKDCKPGTYGLNCAEQCKCISENTELCDRINGTCTCMRGWKGDQCSVDINECEVVSCPVNSYCVNTNGSYTCDCDRGFAKAGQTCKACEGFQFGVDCTSACDNCNKNINECTVLKDHGCLHICMNTEGSYYCSCKAGQFGDGNNCTPCNDYTYGINCTNGCQCNANNTARPCDKATGECSCKEGWTGETCDEDINECSHGNNCNLRANTGCHNTVGSYECSCFRGFVLDGQNCVIDSSETTTKAGSLDLAAGKEVTFDGNNISARADFLGANPTRCNVYEALYGKCLHGCVVEDDDTSCRMQDEKPNKTMQPRYTKMVFNKFGFESFEDFRRSVHLPSIHLPKFGGDHPHETL
ncbi:FBN1-like protein, partial [Mya arenaria]